MKSEISLTPNKEITLLYTKSTSESQQFQFHAPIANTLKPKFNDSNTQFRSQIHSNRTPNPNSSEDEEREKVDYQRTKRTRIKRRNNKILNENARIAINSACIDAAALDSDEEIPAAVEVVVA